MELGRVEIKSKGQGGAIEGRNVQAGGKIGRRCCRIPAVSSKDESMNFSSHNIRPEHELSGGRDTITSNGC